ncbi:response regulator [Pseudobacteriovorax antillogorgiicola]|uniref:CheY chemotaxis protein or a CheY-like REC (Receiver) domain n=1 Tax=Pseudobacteriovorax antillogorgiicola TaxID=1513793 RepID=A0A1Y6BHR8_9BACT|nr:response regulator [Pseudobacteriovorax antillogorgiicola]TCS56493.1 CheY-like chemotaxis protein [Pseudobacteriovorax antillogorgiicola]SMF04822.1 CheY chemotaxis protein or a CheY-like REC (receiver) domain [Pseudobacteriovorax antillogorgiicola]
MRMILAIDDSKVALMQVKKYVHKIFPDCELISSTSPSEGIELAKKHGNNIDLAIIDFNMKEMTGLEVLESICDSVDINKIVICTANLQKILEAKVTERGARYVEKPLSQEKMNQICEEQSRKAS